jgi:DNA polymerase-1
VNYQNIPRSDKVVKKAFVPKLDAFLFADYEQIELRLLAFYMSSLGDDSMTQAIVDGKDLHTESAIGALRLARAPSDEERQVGKTLNFSMVYGGGKPTLVRQLGLSWDEAGRLLSNFHETWPGIRLVQDSIREMVVRRGLGYDRLRARSALEEARRRRNGVSELMEVAVRGGGYVTTLWGRHLHPESDHKALNALVQGCAADLMRNALVKVHKHLRGEGLRSHLVSQVHDEIIIDAAEDELPTLASCVPVLMDHAPISQVVPIGTDLEVSRGTWADKETYREETYA